MIILGIDPGVSGAFAIYDKSEARVACHDMPDTTAGLHTLVMSLPPIHVCVLEKPFYPKMIGVKNVARIAEAYGKIVSALTWRDIPVREVRPAEWKAALNLSSHKAASRELAGLCFPADADQWTLVKHDGRAESALLAWYGIRWTK